MMSATGWDYRSSMNLVGVTAACFCVVAAGCNGSASTEQRIKEAYASSGITRVAVYPLAGSVTVDRQPPNFKSRRTSIVVLAYDPSKPDRPIWHNPHVTLQSDGSFAFPDGGLPAGKYVLLFAELTLQKKQGWHGPDELKNLYNDPDVNGKKEQFTIDHQAPGKSDYSFNLNVIGENAPQQPGPKALTQLPG